MRRIIMCIIATILLNILYIKAYPQLVPMSQQGTLIERNITWNSLIKKLQEESIPDQERLQQIQTLLKTYERIPEIKSTEEWGDIAETWNSIVKETDPNILLKRFKEVEPFIIAHQDDAVLRVTDLSVNEVLGDIENNFETITKLTTTLQKQLEVLPKKPLNDVSLKELYEKSITSLKELTKNFHEYAKLTKKIRKEIEDN